MNKKIKIKIIFRTMEWERGYTIYGKISREKKLIMQSFDIVNIFESNNFTSIFSRKEGRR